MALAEPAPVDFPATAHRPNPNRTLEIEIDERAYLRLPLKTRVLTSNDDLLDIVAAYAAPDFEEGDVLFISEKAVAVTQGRAIPEDQIKIGMTARVLWRFVKNASYGIGLRRPSSMQCAVNECGAPRIWLAAIAGGLGKLIGRSGDFYRIAGPQAAMIDAATTSPLQPDCVILGPKEPRRVAQRLHSLTGIPIAIVDVNDVGGSWVVGASTGVDIPLVESALRDNPLGQGEECTPMGLLRRA